MCPVDIGLQYVNRTSTSLWTSLNNLFSSAKNNKLQLSTSSGKVFMYAKNNTETKADPLDTPLVTSCQFENTLLL